MISCLMMGWALPWGRGMTHSRCGGNRGVAVRGSGNRVSNEVEHPCLYLLCEPVNGNGGKHVLWGIENYVIKTFRAL